MADTSACNVEATTPNEGTWSETKAAGIQTIRGLALRAVANKLPLHRRHIRSDAKFASGMTLEAAGQRIPGFNRSEIPVTTRRTGPRGQPASNPDMG
eukprot:16016757-Heterocapsa_arctica.AAC.1